MQTRLCLLLVGILLLLPLAAPVAMACCPAPPSGKPVVNADQSVIIIWDAASKTQHFIRKASFNSAADDFGFLIPTPSQPELNESGNDAFSFLQRLTEPEVKKQSRPASIGCSANDKSRTAHRPTVRVLEEKLVAGFDAVVLEAQSADSLITWLKDHGFAFSPEVEAWAKPYVEGGWKITALKVAKDKDATDRRSVAASALRMTFKTDRPLFPYREPDSSNAAQALGAKQRLLRVYFIAEAKYRGELTMEVPWTGKVAWSNNLTAEARTKTLELLKLPASTGPTEWWMTEFEDAWPYRVAPADLYFSRSQEQDRIKRPPIIEYAASGGQVDGSFYVLATVLILSPLIRKSWRASRQI